MILCVIPSVKNKPSTFHIEITLITKAHPKIRIHLHFKFLKKVHNIQEIIK